MPENKINYDLPDEVEKQLKNGQDIKLRIIATVEKKSDSGLLYWGIYFNVKKISDYNSLTDRNIWIVPLNKETNTISKNPELLIKCNKLVVKNKINIVDTNDGDYGVANLSWIHYKFWYKSEGDLKYDLELDLNPDSEISFSRVPEKIAISYQYLGNNKEWYCWKIEDNDLSERLLTLSSPASKIIDSKGKYINHEIVFGFIKHELAKVGFCPFITINSNNFIARDFKKDCCIYWFSNRDQLENGRDDNVIIQNKKPNEEFNAEKFSEDQIDGSNFKNEIHADFILENKTQLSVIYTKAYNLSFNGINMPVKIVQISRRDKDGNIGLTTEKKLILTTIYTKISKLKNIQPLSKNLIESIKNGIQNTQSSNPVGIVPQVTKFIQTIPEDFVAEWIVNNNEDNCDTFNNFILNKSLCFDNQTPIIDDKINVFNANINLELIKDTDNKNIQLTNAGIQTYITNQQINDNGTLLRVNLSNYSLSETNIIDGAFEFELKPSAVLDDLKGLPNRYGKLRFTLQNKKTQTPFFLWQGTDKINNDIVLQYAIEDFSLPVKNVKAAGQDLLLREKYLAPGTIGAVVEGFGERNESSLVIPINKKPKVDKVDNYLLTFSESVNIGQDYRLDIKLQEINHEANKDNSTNIKAVLLDTNPQFIGLIDAKFLQQPGYDDGAWILARRSQLSLENGAWEILDDKANTEGFKLILPSQANGEAYVKTDINDKGFIIDNQGRPITDNEGNLQKPEKIGEPQEDTPIQYKFGAPAILRLANERLERRYVSPPWNLRSIWGQPGDEAPGVPFLEAQFELLYGLSGYVKPEKTNIAEIASKLGEIPVPPSNSIFWEPTKDQQTAFTTSWGNYLKFYRAWKSRLAILEPSLGDDFGNAKFTDKDKLKYNPRIEFRSKLLKVLTVDVLNKIKEKLDKLAQSDDIVKLKKDVQSLIVLIEENKPENESNIKASDKALKEALKTNPKTEKIFNGINVYERVGASLRYPILDKTVIPENGQITPEDLSDLDKKIAAAHDKNGLAGGFHYGFESPNIYKEFWREAWKDGSSSSELIAPAFSSLGGWGKQAAKFAGDKTVIKSTTAMGRTHFYAVERIGRIGVLWHKAKHVIEYERTVVPSVYFKKQPGLLGRPVVRKVREYIEILEPDKHYPDYPGHSDDAPGSIKSCSFKSKIIPVRSSWGRDVSFYNGNDKVDESGNPILDNQKKPIPDVRNYGWEIPLWHPDADPKLFPKPQVAFELVPPKDANIKSRSANIDEPQNLWFYTDTREKVSISTSEKIYLTADTTKWPAVKYTDYTDLPLPDEKSLKPCLDYDNGANVQSSMPDILDVPPGFERFTFVVELSELPAGVANRYNPNSGISGKLRTVTMTRKPLIKDKDGNETRIDDTYNLLINSEDSVINKIYNGKLNVVSGIDKLSDQLSSYFKEKNGQGKQLNELIKAYNPNTDPNLVHFKDLYNAHKLELNTFPTQYLWKEAIVSSEGLLNRTAATYDEQAKIFKAEIEALIKKGEDYKDEAINSLKKFEEKINLIHTTVDFGIEFFKPLQSQLESVIDYHENEVNAEIDKFKNNIYEDITKIETIINDGVSELSKIKKDTIEILDSAFKTGDTVKSALDRVKLPNDSIMTLKGDIVDRIKNINKTIEDVKNAIGAAINIDKVKELINDFKKKLDADIKSIFAKFDSISDEIKKLVKDTQDFEKGLFKNINNELEKIREKGKKFEEDFKEPISELITQIETNWKNDTISIEKDVDDRIKEIRGFIISEDDSKYKKTLKIFIRDILYKEPFDLTSIFGILKAIDDQLVKFINVIFNSLINLASEFDDPKKIEKWLKSLDAYKQLEAAINGKDAKEIEQKATALVNNINREFGKLAGEVAEKIKEIDKTGVDFNSMVNSGKQVLDNYRSVWQEFTAPGMGLNRKTISMIVNKDWKDVEQRLSITPCISRVKQFENDLEGLGVRLPVTNIFEGLLPPKEEWTEYRNSLLNKFNFSDVLSDIGAMRLDKLFPNFKMPNSFRDNIKVTQGFDKQNLMAWVNAEANIQLDGPQSILNIGPIDVQLLNGKFIAKVRMEMDIEGKTKKENSGTLSGDWAINIAGTAIMVFKEAKAIFNGDKLTFDLDPKRMEMPGLLKMLTNATQNVPVGGGGDGGEEEEVFKIGLLEVQGEEINELLRGRTLPIGVKASLNIPPISVGGGTTAMTNLSFGGYFLLKFWDKGQFGFVTGLGFYMGKREAPFNLTVFFFGGGGYVDTSIMFKPEEGMTVRFIMSVHASVGFAVALGWLNGSVIIMLGLEGEYEKSPHTNPSVSVTIFVQLIGHVDILGIVSVFLLVRLAATYNGAQLKGIGQVVLTIKICWCLTISLNKSYEKTFVGSGSSQRSDAEIAAHAQKIINSLR